MSRALGVYRALERVFGRRALWRAGRFLYHGARRELGGGANTDDLALIDWVGDVAGDEAPVLLDIGANHGMWSVPMARRFAGQGGRLLAFEPAPEQRARLTAALEGIEGIAIDIRTEAVGAAPGTGRFEITGPATGSNGLVADGAEPVASTVEVAITTVDALMQAEGIARVTLAKVDTEGNDMNVLLGARGALEAGRIGVILFEYNHRWIPFGHSLHAVFRLIRGTGYRLGRMTPAGIELYDAWHFEIERYTQSDWVLISAPLVDRLPCKPYRFDPANVAVEAR